MPSYNETETALQAIARRLQQNPSPAGALFRVLITRLAPSPRFATAHVVFDDHPRGQTRVEDYRTVLFLEEWVEGPEAFERLRALVAGSGVVAGESIPLEPGAFRYAAFDDEPIQHHSDRLTLWPEYHGRFDWNDPNGRSGGLPLPPGHIGGIELPIFRSIAHLVDERLYDRRASERSGTSIRDGNALAIVVPDLRARIDSAQRVGSRYTIRIRSQVPMEDLQVHLLPPGASSDARFKTPPENGVITFSDETPIESGGAQPSVYLLHRGDRTMLQEEIVSEAIDQDATPPPPDLRSLVLRDLMHGENETVEYKPFVRPGDDKEAELLHTIVAFLNTQGGQLYIGVADDDATPLGIDALGRAYGADLKTAQSQVDKQLRKLIRWIDPVPTDFRIELSLTAGPDESPVFMLAVPASDARPHAVAVVGPPKTFGGGLFYIRRGANNYKADRTTVVTLTKRDAPASTLWPLWGSGPYG